MMDDMEVQASKFLQDITIPCLDDGINERQLRLISKLAKHWKENKNFSCDPVIQMLRTDDSFKGGFVRYRLHAFKSQAEYAKYREYLTAYELLLDLAYPTTHSFVFIRLLTGGLYNYNNPPSVLRMAYSVVTADELRDLDKPINSIFVMNCLSTRGMPLGKGTRPFMQTWAMERYPEYFDKQYEQSFDEALNALLTRIPAKVNGIEMTYQLIGTGLGLTDSFLRDEPNGKKLLKQVLRYRIDLNSLRSLDKSTNDGRLVNEIGYHDHLVEAIEQDIKLVRAYLQQPNPQEIYND